MFILESDKACAQSNCEDPQYEAGRQATGRGDDAIDAERVYGEGDELVGGDQKDANVGHGAGDAYIPVVEARFDFDLEDNVDERDKEF